MPVFVRSPQLPFIVEFQLDSVDVVRRSVIKALENATITPVVLDGETWLINFGAVAAISVLRS